MISENNEKAQYLDSERTEPGEIVVFLEKRMKSDRYWITVSCQDFEQEFFDVMKELGMKELEPEKDFRLKLLFRTNKMSQARRMVRDILHWSEVHGLTESLKVQAVTQPICSTCGAFNKFIMAGKTCFKCGGQVSMKRDVLVELLTGTERKSPSELQA
jgi:hypothetical protein